MNIISAHGARALRVSALSLSLSFKSNYIQNMTNMQIFMSSTSKLKQPTFFSRNIYRFSSEEGEKKKLSRQQQFKKDTEEQLQKPLQEELEENKQSYSKSENKLTKYLMGVSVIALLMFYGLMEVQSLRVEKKLDRSVSGVTKISSVGKVQIGGEWKLTDTKGKRFGSEDLQGSYYLIYFGFTNCPDICPNSLIKLSRAIEKIRKSPEYQYLDLKVIFVSVDPDRDTPEKIEKFLAYFDKNMIGVTGKSNNDPQLKQCMRKFKIYASKIEFEDDDVTKQGRKSYTIDHTILTYLMSDSNQYLAHLGGNMGEHDLAKAIVQKIFQDQQTKYKILKIT